MLHHTEKNMPGRKQYLNGFKGCKRHSNTSLTSAERRNMWPSPNHHAHYRKHHFIHSAIAEVDEGLPETHWAPGKVLSLYKRWSKKDHNSTFHQKYSSPQEPCKWASPEQSPALCCGYLLGTSGEQDTTSSNAKARLVKTLILLTVWINPTVSPLHIYSHSQDAKNKSGEPIKSHSTGK